MILLFQASLGDTDDATMMQVMDRMNKVLADLQKCNKFSSSVLSKAERVENPSSVLVSRREELWEALQNLETTTADVSYLLRFKKSKEGQGLSETVAKTATELCAQVLQATLDSSKQVKALLPSRSAK